MKRVFIFGILGRMGKQLRSLIDESESFTIAGGFDTAVNNIIQEPSKNNFDVPIFDRIENVNIDFDLIIDFSSPAALGDLVYIAQKRKVPLIIAATGYSQREQEKIRALANLMPVFMSSNMSIGMNAVLNVLPRLLKLCGESFDIEIIERHHNKKKDAPSGTAQKIYEKLNIERALSPTYGRHSSDHKRDNSEVGIHSIRGGSIIGEHEIILCGPQEVVSIKHSALSRDAFAIGALRAAEFIIDKKKGFFNEIE